MATSGDPTGPSDPSASSQPATTSTNGGVNHGAASSSSWVAKPDRRSRGLVIGLVVAIVVAVVATGFAVYNARQLDEWEAAAEQTLEVLAGAGIQVGTSVVSGVEDYEDRIAQLSGDLEDSQTQAEIAQAQASEAEQELSDVQAELATTQAELEETQAELEETQAQLAEAEAALAQVGEVILADGTYTGPVMAAQSEPNRLILFEDGGLWRVAPVADDATITSGGQELTLEEFEALLASTDPADIELVNGPYKVTVKQGEVTSLRKAEG
jgi:hypothetical protein